MGTVEMLFSASYGECAIVMDGEVLEKFNMKCIMGEEEISEPFNSPKISMIYNKEYRDGGITYSEKIKELTEYVENTEEFNKAEEARLEELRIRNEKRLDYQATMKAKEEKINKVKAKMKNRATSKEVELNGVKFNAYTASYLERNKGLNFKNIKAGKNAIEAEPGLYVAHKDIIDRFKK